jgi:hypothetical protein
VRPPWTVEDLRIDDRCRAVAGEDGSDVLSCLHLEVAHGLFRVEGDMRRGDYPLMVKQWVIRWELLGLEYIPFF